MLIQSKGHHRKLVKSFLKLVKGLEETDNIFAQKFEMRAKEIKANETWRKNMMQTMLREQDLIDRGIREGAHQKAIESAKKLIKRGYPLEDIAEDLGISLF